MSKQKPSRCPSCEAARVARILYGMRLVDKKLRRELDAGEVILGGCVICDGDPEWQCVACRHRWGALNISDVLNRLP